MVLSTCQLFQAVIRPGLPMRMSKDNNIQGIHSTRMITSLIYIAQSLFNLVGIFRYAGVCSVS